MRTKRRHRSSAFRETESRERDPRRQNDMLFCVLVAILAVADVAVAVVGSNNQDSLGKQIVEFYASMYGLYVTGGDPVIGVTLRFIHSLLHCCGVTGFTPLELLNDTCPPADSVFEKFKMPFRFDSGALLAPPPLDATAPLIGAFSGAVTPRSQ
ncbi:CD9 antigen [Liparis tanakae]|uniref:CD9 antigen n=1 Tax=Liparis tanakae TaxID=230148 RepID=A0A4Z2G3M3_9TELE|nr:CD9 antigen [Liparis tanakae]